MAYSFANWRSASSTHAITAVDVAARTVSVSGDVRKLVRVGGQLSVDAGANVGTYDVAGVIYAPNASVITLSVAPASATVAGNVVLGPDDRTRAHFLRLHLDEVAAQIKPSVGSDGVTYAAGGLNDYYKSLEQQWLSLSRRSSGLYVYGRLR